MIFCYHTVPAKNAWRLPLLSFQTRFFCFVSFVYQRHTWCPGDRPMSNSFAIVRLGTDYDFTDFEQLAGNLMAATMRSSREQYDN